MVEQEDSEFLSPHNYGQLPDAGGGPQHPRVWEEHPRDQVGCVGGMNREEKWRLDGTRAPEGWLGERRCSHAWKGHRWFGGLREECG